MVFPKSRNMWDIHRENYQSEGTEDHNMNLVHHNKLFPHPEAENEMGNRFYCKS